jgi:formylglycine-generating enzyme required for sulfatase activity
MQGRLVRGVGSLLQTFAARLDECARYKDNSDGRTHRVAQKRPNAWGLYDLHGNAEERCHDWFGEDYYRDSPTEDPQGPEDGMTHVVRGGSWKSLPGDCRWASRRSPLFTEGPHIGFRVVATVEE